MSNAQAPEKSGEKGKAGFQRVVKPKEIPAKVSLTSQSRLTLAEEKRLNNAFSLSIVTSGATRSFTISNPIGVTQYGKDQFVINPSGEVATLLGRAKDPSRQTIENARSIYRSNALVSAGFLIKGNNSEELHYIVGGKPSDVVRKFALSVAQKALEKAARIAREGYDAGIESGKISEGKPFVFAETRLDHLLLEVKPVEIEIEKFLNSDSFKEEIEKKFPFTYETMAGVLADQPQELLHFDSNVRTAEQAADALSMSIMRMATEGFLLPLRKKVLAKEPVTEVVVTPPVTEVKQQTKGKTT